MIYGYIRVSHDRQAESGLGLAAQKSKIASHAKSIKSQKLAKIFSDAAVSASRKPLLQRPQGHALDQAVKRGDHVIIAKLDRAFRRLADFAVIMERWAERGVYVHLLDIGVDTSTLSGKLLAGVMASVASFEAGRIGERIHEAKEMMRTAGKAVNGRFVIGYTVKRGKLTPNQSARKIGQLIIRLRKEGNSFPAISDELNRRRHRTAEGKPWSRQAVWRAYWAARYKYPIRGINEIIALNPRQKRNRAS